MQSIRPVTSALCGTQFRRSISNSVDHVAIERYKTIWTFFRRQYCTPCRSNLHEFRLTDIHQPRTGFRTAKASEIFLSRSFLRGQTRSICVYPKKQDEKRANFAREEMQRLKNEHSSPERSSEQRDMPETNLDDSVRRRQLEEYSLFFRRLAMSLPPMQRPTRDDFLKVATNFWQRLRIRFQWFTVRSFRKFNADDISAFLTWFLMSQTVWILVGT